MSGYLHTYQNTTFKGVLTWDQLDQLWEKVLSTRGAGWYTYTVGETVPERPAYGDELVSFVRDVNALLRHRHRQEHCGMVYADDREAPGFVMVFDPYKVGGCGLGGTVAIPSWTLSREAPQDLVQALEPPLPQGMFRKIGNWLQKNSKHPSIS